MRRRVRGGTMAVPPRTRLWPYKPWTYKPQTLGCRLKLAVLRAGNNGILHGLGQVDKLGGVACHTDQQILIVLRMGLSVTQHLGGDAVELDMEGAQREQGLDHGAQVGLAALGSHQVVIQTQVQQRTTRSGSPG